MGVPHLHKNENAVPHLLLKSKMDDNQNKNNFENRNNFVEVLCFCAWQLKNRGDFMNWIDGFS